MQDEIMKNNMLSQTPRQPEIKRIEPSSISKKLKDLFKSRGWYRTVKFARGPFQHLLLIIGSLFFVLPFVWMLSTALKSDQDLFRTPPTWLPYDFKTVQVNGQALPLYNVTVDNTTRQLAMVSVSKGLGVFVDPANPGEQLEIRTKYAKPILIVKPRWQNFPDAIARATREGTGVNFLTYTKNSLIISFFTILGTLISCTTAGYAFARIQWPGRDILFLLVLASIMLPFQVHRNVKTVTVASTGLDRGSTIWLNICHSLAPSTRAASHISSGMVRKNCLKRKIIKAFPKNAGTINGKYVFSHPILSKRR